MARLSRLFVLALAVGLPLASAGCGAGWHREHLRPRSLAQREEALIYSGTQVTHLHSVVVSPDSVIGVSATQTPRCVQCRVALPASAIDSMRVGDPVRGLLKTVALGEALALATVIIVHVAR